MAENIEHILTDDEINNLWRRSGDLNDWLNFLEQVRIVESILLEELSLVPSAIWHEGKAIFVGEGNEDRFCKEWGAKRIYLGERK